ncbi:echinoderm microtubule-associated protein-like CG42247 isoform X2 [Stegodyphus dumicola]|uniref:echinoderm microtubule-associated protein-like CG42247 isoform X2 n=1 Tax=Stegodyphus dumicola TaxID=202533 RepID=UPI0015B28737|nr:echinoderm microtubule-associated protein-like CG42247 isoform X2 [Stegodyphus dumicola]
MKSSSGLRAVRSLGDLGDKRAFDIKVGYGRKRIPPIGPSGTVPKALVVTVYRNGDPYFPGTRVSVNPGKNFHNLAGFCDYLSQRLKIPQGVRYMFDLKGQLITELHELTDGNSYVASGTKTFKDASYGKLARLQTGQAPVKPNPAPLRPEDMLLYRQHQDVKDPSPEGWSLPGSRESCVVTVVNRKEPSRRSRVLLNLKTKQSWEDVLRDMGQAVGINRVTRMLTPWGEEVRSFSHLKNDFSEVETFYLDNELNKSISLRRSNSDSNIKGKSKDVSLRVRIPEDSRRRWLAG